MHSWLRSFFLLCGCVLFALWLRSFFALSLRSGFDLSPQVERAREGCGGTICLRYICHCSDGGSDERGARDRGFRYRVSERGSETNT